MNADFHYYATHLAARYAGFTREQADIVCYAAQLVDEVAWGAVTPFISVKPFDSPDRTTYMTTEEIGRVAATSPSWTRESIRRIAEIWQCFHFLPGNEFYRYTYQGKEKDTIFNWNITDEEKDLCRQMCLPQSVAVWNMVEDIKQYRFCDNYLHMLGLRMHVLADTWAHQYYLGIPKWCYNEIDVNNVKILVNGRWKKASLNTISSISTLWSDSLEKLMFQHTGISTSYESVFYLGHGRIGSIPDYGCLEYEYHPQWMAPGKTIRKNNVEVFTNAFHQMYYALKCVRDNIAFDPEHIPTNYKQKVQDVLKTWKLNQSAEWNALIQKEFGYTLQPFNKDKWFTGFEANSGGDYLQFINAADAHVSLVKRMVSSTRFQHKSNDGTSCTHSYVINHLDWNRKNRATVCIAGKMYSRLAENGVPTGKLQQMESVDYLEHNYHDEWKMTIDASSKIFRHSHKTVPERHGNLCNYCSWDDKNALSAIIEEGIPMAVYQYISDNTGNNTGRLSDDPLPML